MPDEMTAKTLAVATVGGRAIELTFDRLLSDEHDEWIITDTDRNYCISYGIKEQAIMAFLSRVKRALKEADDA